MTRVRTYSVVIEQDEDGWYVGDVPELPGCHTQARTMDELMANIKEAILLYLDVRGEPPASVRFIGVKQVEVEA